MPNGPEMSPGAACVLKELGCRTDYFQRLPAKAGAATANVATETVSAPRTREMRVRSRRVMAQRPPHSTPNVVLVLLMAGAP